MNVGERIAFFRTQKGYTVNKLANLSGISQSYLRDVELGNKNPTIEVLSYICDALDISLKTFFDDEAKESLVSDSIVNKIYKLNSEQQNALLAFIDTLIK